MESTPHLAGVFAAALTPLTQNHSPDYPSVPVFLKFLAERGCHGALLLGTTGEGPSFSGPEKLAILETALLVKQEYPDFKLLLGTGSPSLDETIQLTRAAFERGADGVVVLPPYYFRKAAEEGLLAWFSRVLENAVPDGGCFLAYHIPAVTGVPVSADLLARLKDAFPRRFQGLKDSSGDPEHTAMLGKRFGNDLLVFNGSDRLFSHALANGAAGCITAMANLYSPDLRQVWDAFQDGKPDPQVQARLDAARAVMDRFPPAAPLLKALLARRHAFPLWPVCPPLMDCPSEWVNSALQDLP
jgi:4-hydroxy-tetrahydrodipicolinate synthase